MTSSRKIPSGIQREVRQRCGFGCVICGLPLYEYEHMMEWATVKRHVADEITLLCDHHHREKTNGLLSVEQVRQANLNPFNLRSGVSKPYDLHYEGAFAAGEVGGNTFVVSFDRYPNRLHFVTIDGISLINFTGQDGHLFLNINLFDDAGRTILVIENNVLIYKIDSWDIRLTGRNLIINQASRNILVDIIFEVPNKVILRRGKILLNGVELDITPEHIDLIPAYMRFEGNLGIGYNTGIRIGRRVEGLTAAFGVDHPVRHEGYENFSDE